jgi:N-acylglucosamine 2-epimerase
MKFWWPHNEAIIATLLAHIHTGDAKYAEMHRQIHDWSYAHFPDRENSEWYGYLDRAGKPTSELKGNMWKGPFHMPRQKYVCWQLLEGRYE